ncbi:hypothetical protein BCR33DRAFT_779711 [Rhizoclosmatium globosum]|uniref:Sensitive to high expression protein 9, mitochondrial n=1 Tax=Rhizoclosmatium globosum TaxID=329046 RepID=A0A1Y2CZE2_9FUNG|nr:hypothetical protein BCR33DRAFT_779711 [Rhizoclosmatium globosum]|eukprot:ORY52398.1 hypothetical protein BCR33DRAFT_779711 [Rhizoclosmatium globosum]
MIPNGFLLRTGPGRSVVPWSTTQAFSSKPGLASSSHALVLRLRSLQDQYVPALSEFLNAATGYDAVVDRKRKVEEKDAELKAAMAALDHAKLKYEESIDERRRTQKEINSLLQRKDSWVDQDIHRFTDLYRRDLTLESAETAMKLAYKNASDSYEVVHQDYLNQIRERYIDEQLYSDKIRSASTWWTVGLISVHLVIFLMVSIRDPWVKKRDRALIQELVQKENALLEAKVLAAVSAVATPSVVNDGASTENANSGVGDIVLAVPWVVTPLRIPREQASFVAGVCIGGFVSILSVMALR